MGEFANVLGGHRNTAQGGGGLRHNQELGTGWKVISDPRMGI